MAREIKRLFERWDPPDIDELIQRDSQSWGKELEWWRRVGVGAKTLLSILENSYVERKRYEARLEDRLTRESTRQRIRKAWKDAALLIHLLKTERIVGDDGSPILAFGDLGEQVEHAVRSYIDARLSRLIPRGRPGEPWLVRCVVVLAVQLMAGPFPDRRSGRGVRLGRWERQSEKGTIRAIERVLKLAGHGDVVTEEKIRHTIRRIRPGILKAHEPRSSSWAEATPPAGRGAMHGQRVRRSQVSGGSMKNLATRRTKRMT